MAEICGASIIVGIEPLRASGKRVIVASMKQGMRTIIIALVALAAPVHAQEMDPMLLNKATGMADIIYGAGPCKFTIDQNKLDAYLKSSKLGGAEYLGIIMNYVIIKELNGPPSNAECAIALSTARAIGIIKE